MPAALIGATRCARCGYEQSAGERCGQCTAPWASAAAGSVVPDPHSPLSGVVRASVPQRYLAHLVDAVVALAPLGLAVGLAAVVPWPVPWELAVAAAATVVAGQLLFLTGRGRTLGRLVLRERTVDDLTGTPVRLGRLARRLGGAGWHAHLVTADLRRGRDPLTVRLDRRLASTAAGSLLPRGATLPQASPPMAARRSATSVGVVFDTGERYEISGALLLGRSPVDTSDSGDRALLARPDLTRRLAKTHALLEWSGGVLWVTDLHSATGTALVPPGGERQPLVPGVRSAAAVGATVECGGRTLKVVPGGG